MQIGMCLCVSCILRIMTKIYDYFYRIMQKIGMCLCVSCILKIMPKIYDTPTPPPP